MSKKKLRIIVNPISGVGRQKVIPELVEQHLDKTQFDYEIAYTKASKHAIELSKTAADAGYDVVAVVGGDGSVNEAGTGLLGSETALAIVPTGSGNGLARHAEIPLELEAAIKLLNDYRVKRIDTGLLNGHHFMGVAGTGFDALIADKFSSYGTRGFFSYFKIVLREYFAYREQVYTIKNGKQSFSQKAFLLTFANSSQYGNRATIAPRAVLDDGKLKLCVLGKFSLFEAPFVAYRLFNKSIHKSRHMRILEGETFEIEHTGDKVHLDGEPLNLAENIKVKVYAASLNLVVPKT